MSHYRKINVGELEFEYVIGKDVVKVKGFDPIPIRKVGEVKRVANWCELCGERCGDAGFSEKVEVTPKMVTRAIRSLLSTQKVG